MNRVLVLLLCGLPLAASAQIYKWTDANGQVHFGQNPPRQGNYSDVTPTLPVSGTSTDGHAATIPGTAGGKPGAASPPSLQAKADYAERCAKANERISFLNDHQARRLMVTGDDGQPARMTEDQFNQQLKDAQDAAAKYCGG